MADTSKQDVEFLQQFEPDVFWRQHGKKILAGLAVVVLVGLVVYYRQKQAAEQAEAAAAELATAGSPAACKSWRRSFVAKRLAPKLCFASPSWKLAPAVTRKPAKLSNHFWRNIPIIQ